MKKAFIALVCVLALSIALASPALAGGDQLRGDNGQGDVNQVQVMNPPPFQEP
jgi:hypothetical protein